MCTALLPSSPVLVYNPYAFAAHEDPHTVYSRLSDEAATYWNSNLGIWVLGPMDETKCQWSEKALIVGEGTRSGATP